MAYFWLPFYNLYFKINFENLILIGCWIRIPHRQPFGFSLNVLPWSNAFLPGLTPFGPPIWQAAEADTELTLSASLPQQSAKRRYSTVWNKNTFHLKPPTWSRRFFCQCYHSNPPKIHMKAFFLSRHITFLHTQWAHKSSSQLPFLRHQLFQLLWLTSSSK